MDRLNVLAAVCAFCLVFILGCGQQPKKNNRIIEGDPERKQTPEEKKALEILKSKGAFISWHEPKNGNKPFWEISLQAEKITDADLDCLKNIINLRRVGIGANGLNVTDQGIAKLAELQELEEVRIGGASISNHIIAKLVNIKTLSLSKTKVTGEGLRSLKALETLSVRGNFTDEGLKGFKELKNLEYLDLAETQVTGVGLGELAHLPSLKTLRLNRTQVETIKHLSPCPALEFLELNGTKIENQGLEHIQEFKSTCPF